MFKNLKLKIKNSIKGITIVEIIVTVFIIAMFSAIIISNFPKFRRQFSLSAATHNLAINLRGAQDMALSGKQISDDYGNPLPVKGFGVYINVNPINGNNKEYVIYGDNDGDEQYDSLVDYTLETIDMDKETKGIIIKGLYNVLQDNVSINFSPPNPKTSISTLQLGMNRVKIVLCPETDTNNVREIYVYTSGLIEIK